MMKYNYQLALSNTKIISFTFYFRYGLGNTNELPLLGDDVTSLTTISLIAVCVIFIVLLVLLTSILSYLKRSKQDKNQFKNGSVSICDDADENQRISNCFFPNTNEEVALSIGDLSNGYNNLDVTFDLPNWLFKKRGMIYPQDKVEKQETLGRGKYGVVFKGRLMQGNAVYVNLSSIWVIFFRFYV